jgi:hypothetical protein
VGVGRDMDEQHGSEQKEEEMGAQHRQQER